MEENRLSLRNPSLLGLSSSEYSNMLCEMVLVRMNNMEDDIYLSVKARAERVMTKRELINKEVFSMGSGRFLDEQVVISYEPNPPNIERYSLPVVCCVKIVAHWYICSSSEHCLKLC